MNEQQLADLFSEQLDRLLQGEPTALPPDAGDLPELFETIRPATSQTHFQAGSAAQAAFRSQMAGWFGLANGGSPMTTILGLSKVWFISIVVAIVTVVTGAGFIALVATSVLVFSGVGQIPASPTTTTTTTVVTTGTPAATPVVATTATPVMTGTLSMTPTNELPPLIFINHPHLPNLCAGVYTTQSTLVNVGNLPVNDAALAWEVIEGADLVDQVNINSAGLIPVADNAVVAPNPVAVPVAAPSTVVVTGNPVVSFADFQPISVKQDVKLDVKVKVKDDWWKHKNKTDIKIKLSIKNKRDIHPHYGHRDHSQIITIVRQDARWVTLTGFPHNFGDNRMFVDGHIVVVNNCTGLPINWPPGSNIQVVGRLQPDGTFLAISIVVININVITGDFDSGVPFPTGGSGGGGKGGGSKGGGSKGGGSKGK